MRGRQYRDDPRAVEAIRRCESLVHEWHRQIAVLQGRLIKIAVSAIGEGDAPRAADVRACIEETLSLDSHFVGAGFVSGHPQIRSSGGGMVWWQLREREGGAQLQPLDADQTGVGDYQHGFDDSEWYSVPLRTGAACMVGPYVDYLCTDDFTLTFSAPVLIDGEFFGIVGVDVIVRDIERDLDGLLERIDANAVLLANGRSIVVSRDPDFETGRRLTREALEKFEIWSIAGTAFSLGLPRSG
ncbi:cache domain-containing protein [Brevibacterium rongguiense]